MTERASEGRAQEARRRYDLANEGFAAYEIAMTKRVVLCLRAVAAELDQGRPEVDSPLERRERATGCLRKLRESEQLLGSMSRRP